MIEGLQITTQLLMRRLCSNCVDCVSICHLVVVQVRSWNQSWILGSVLLLVHTNFRWDLVSQRITHLWRQLNAFTWCVDVPASFAPCTSFVVHLIYNFPQCYYQSWDIARARTRCSFISFSHSFIAPSSRPFRWLDSFQSIYSFVTVVYNLHDFL